MATILFICKACAAGGGNGVWATARGLVDAVDEKVCPFHEALATLGRWSDRTIIGDLHFDVLDAVAALAIEHWRQRTEFRKRLNEQARDAARDARDSWRDGYAEAGERRD